MRLSFRQIALGAAAALGVMAIAGIAGARGDFGQDIENQARAHSNQNFGIGKPLEESSTTNINAATALADPTKLATLAKGLDAKTVAVVDGAPNIDMIALWPNDTNPTHLIACNEQGAAQIGLIRISLADGSSQVIVHSGLTSCDPVNRTPWGTIVFGEENGASGRAWELINPLNTTNVDIVGGVPMNGTNPGNIVERTALGKLSFEGIVIFPSGVVYYADERRPDDGNPGGALYKFIPTTLRTATTPIASLADSPLVGGSVYGLRVGVRPTTDYGQATQTGMAAWVPANVAPFPNLGGVQNALKFTGYYRPEDYAMDQAAFADGQVRFCGNNTGNEATSGSVNGHTWGETICVTDGTVAQANANTAIPEVQYLVIGNAHLSMMDNIAYQPGRGNWIIHEDGEELTGHNDLWACMDDGMDDDVLSDSCVRIASLNDGTGNPGGDAEWTGGVFSGDGKHFYVSVQHNVTGKGIVLDITGWK